jgi:membrane peptidoglycan carboxypeptidase
MQLARNLFLNHERTVGRKLSEIDLAKKLEQHFTKEQILLLYLKHSLFWKGAHGIWAAAQEEYFQKTPDKLTLPESAVLVGLLQSPGGYDPDKKS